MKKLNGLIVLILTIILLSGCAMKQEITMKINRNKSLELNFISAFDNELIDMMISSDKEEDDNFSYDDFKENTKEYTDVERWEFLEKSLKDGEDGLFKEASEKNLKVKKYEKDDFKGYVFTGEIANIDEITVNKESELDVEDVTELADSKLFVKNKGVYKAVLPFDTDGEYDTSNIPNNMGIDMKLIVTLPDKAISSNATTVSEDGKTLTWDLMKLSGKNITFEFKFPQNIILTISLIIGIIIVFVIVLAAIISNKKDKTNIIDNLSDNKDNQNDEFDNLNKELLEKNGNQGIMDLYNTQTSLKKITNIENIDGNSYENKDSQKLDNTNDNYQDKQS